MGTSAAPASFDARFDPEIRESREHLTVSRCACDLKPYAAAPDCRSMVNLSPDSSVPNIQRRSYLPCQLDRRSRTKFFLILYSTRSWSSQAARSAGSR